MGILGRPRRRKDGAVENEQRAISETPARLSSGGS